MNSEDLDKILQHKLNALQPEAADDAWDVLARRMDREAEALASRSPIDAPMQQRLNALRPACKAGHWQQLAQRLHTERQLRKKLFISKSIELSLVCLLLFTLGRLVDQKPVLPASDPSGVEIAQQNTPVTSQDPALASQMADPRVSAGINSKPHPEASSSPAEASSHNAAPVRQVPHSLTNNSQGRRENHRSGQSHVSRGQRIANRNAAQGNQQSAIAAASATSINTELPGSLQPSANTDPQQPLFSAGQPASADPGNPQAGNEKNVLLLDRLPLAEAHLQHERAEDEISSRIRKTKLSRIWTPTIGLVCGFSNNKIQTPSGGLYSFEFSSQNWISPEIGFTFLLDNQLFGVETGLYYSYIQYKGILPRYNSVHFMKVPLNLRIIPLQQEEWNLYFMAGATLHLAASARYDKPSTMDLGTVSDPETYEKGLFEGGEYQSNTYYTYNVGVGFERYYSNNMRVFGQLMRSQSLFDDRFSPSLNKIKATAFQIGMRIPIK